MKKLFSILLAVVMIISTSSLFLGCAKKTPVVNDNNANKETNEDNSAIKDLLDDLVNGGNKDNTDNNGSNGGNVDNGNDNSSQNPPVVEPEPNNPQNPPTTTSTTFGDANYVGAKDIIERDIYGIASNDINDDKITVSNWMTDNFESARDSNTAVYQKLKEVTEGVDIVANRLGDATWEDQIATSIGLNQLSDIFVHYGPERPEQYQRMIENGMILPISDFVDSVTYPNIYKHLTNYTYLMKNLSYAYGKLWSIPVDWQLEHTMYVRLDWIQNLNNKIAEVCASEGRTGLNAQELEAAKFTATGPKDLLEFYRLARAMAKCDPDGNGVDDTFGYTSETASSLFSDCWIFEAFDAGYDRMVNINGTYVSSWCNDNTKKAVAFINKLYQEGIVPQDYFEYDMGGKQEAFAKGKVGIMQAHSWYNTIVKEFLNFNGVYNVQQSDIANARSKIGMFAPPKGENGTSGISGNPNFWTVTCLNAAMTDVELVASLNLMDFLLSEEGEKLMTVGVSGLHHTENAGTYTSLLGKNYYNFNNDVVDVDGATSIRAISNMSLGYLTPFATNADLITAQMELAKSYLKCADYPFLQPTSYVANWSSIRLTALEQLKDMIKRGSELVDSTSMAYPTWDSINALSNNSNFTTRWNNYVSLLEQRNLNVLVADYNAAIPTAQRYVK